LEEDPNEHIGTVELAKLLEESRRRAESAVDAADMHPHLAACPACREQFDDLALLDRQLDRQMKSMRSAESAPRQGDCPDPVVWREIAGGLTPPGERLIYLEHGSRCDLCGPMLREAVAEVSDLNGEITEAERTLIAILDSARAEWQQRLAQQIAGTQHSAGRESTPWWKRWLAIPRLAVPSLAVPRLAIAGASLLAIVAAGSWVAVHRYNNYIAARNQPAAASQLLARAYTEKRTLELRIAGADYAPLRVSRGPAASFTSRPEPLLKAEALIASQLESHPSDPSWLQAKAQADVLEGKYDAAVEALRRALELEPHSTALLTDLATAYFQRAQQEDRKDDLGAAYEYLSQALRLHPDDPVALFNRAIVAEHAFLYHQALDDWDYYLRVDPGSQWGEEARNRANAIREKLKEHESKATPLLSPAQLADATTSATLSSEVDQRIEEYLHEAVRSWLPQAFPEGGANGARATADPRASQALFFLADLMSRQHGDLWLTDLLRGFSAPHFPQAVIALSRAVKANDASEYGVSRQQAELAARLFRASGNSAGALRAEFEQSFADQFSRRSEDCRRRSIAAGAESWRYSYPWVQIQLELEDSVCSVLMGDLGTHEKAARRAQDRAQRAGYGALYLRALGFVADSKLDTGDRPGVLGLVCAGLDRYWSGQFPAMRGYNLYVEEALAAEANQANLQLAIWREAAAVIEAGENQLLRAEAHSSMANAASAAHQPEVAERYYEEAARLYALAPPTEANRANRLMSEILTAQVETGQNAFQPALVRLTRIQDEVRQLSNDFLAQMFYSALGEVQLRGHHAAEAEQAFRSALRLAEQNLASLTSEKSRTSWSKDAAPVYLGLAEAELVQGREQESLDVFEWYLGAPQRAGRRGRSASESLPDPSQLPARLPLLTNQTVLAFGALPDGLAIWVYDDRGVSTKWIPKSAQELQDLAANFYAQCSDPNSALSGLRRDARSLYEALIAPVEQHLAPGRTLVIETDGWLARVPFEALLDSSDRYLTERVSIVHSMGLNSQARLHSDTGISRDLPVLVVGSAASSPADGLIPLPDVAAEADTVASAFHLVHVLKGGDATLSAVRSELPVAAVFHFAGHSLATPGRMGLLLEGEDGKANIPRLMDANVVRQLHLQTLQLAVLSACSTASGSGGSSGFDSVTDALLREGVPHVVASRWAVDSAETRGFVQDFYHNALSGQTVSEAIRLTSRNMLANPRTSHPYYWSAFGAYGRP
jgi:CHAT domain-containing protein/tetratricopeptide (TPR) repeat protein